MTGAGTPSRPCAVAAFAESRRGHVVPRGGPRRGAATARPSPSRAPRAAVSPGRRTGASRRRPLGSGWAATSRARSSAAASASSLARVEQTKPGTPPPQPDHPAGERIRPFPTKSPPAGQARRPHGHAEAPARPCRSRKLRRRRAVAGGHDLRPRAPVPDAGGPSAPGRCRGAVYRVREASIAPRPPQASSCSADVGAGARGPAGGCRGEREHAQRARRPAPRATRPAGRVGLSRALRACGRSRRRTSIPASRRSRARVLMGRGVLYDQGDVPARSPCFPSRSRLSCCWPPVAWPPMGAGHLRRRPTTRSSRTPASSSSPSSRSLSAHELHPLAPGQAQGRAARAATGRGAALRPGTPLAWRGGW